MAKIFRIRIDLLDVFSGVVSADSPDEGVSMLAATLGQHGASVKNLDRIFREMIFDNSSCEDGQCELITQNADLLNHIFDRINEKDGGKNLRTLFVHVGGKEFLNDTPDNDALAADLSNLQGTGAVKTVHIYNKLEVG
ncbi:MAG: hypothetical protein HY370_02610 [Proteobacteria bacterium]|nr:hypothetical protein [Pseudomonadota bacterium]